MRDCSTLVGYSLVVYSHGASQRSAALVATDTRSGASARMAALRDRMGTFWIPVGFFLFFPSRSNRRIASRHSGGKRSVL